MRTTHALLVGGFLLGLVACGQASTPNPDSAATALTLKTPSTVSTSGLSAMQWDYQQGFQPTASSRELRVAVSWVGCASGAAPVNPKAVVSVSRENVSLSVWATPPAGNAFDCQGNQRVNLTVPLTEPLGSRTVVQGAATLR